MANTLTSLFFPIKMGETGFEPAQALSHRILSPAYLATLALPLKKFSKLFLKKLLVFKAEPKILHLQEIFIKLFSFFEE